VENFRILNNMTSIDSTKKVLSIGNRNNSESNKFKKDEFKKKKNRKKTEVDTIKIKESNSGRYFFDKQNNLLQKKMKRTSIDKKVIDIKV
jgi:hypothetical protein